MRRTITTRRFWLTALPTLVLLAIGFYLLAPTRIGGFNTYSIVSGNSMYPKFHGVDLVIARRSGTPSVGQIVVYRSPTLNRLVVHRVVRVQRFAELVRLADQFERLILERHVGDRVQYTVRHDSTAYVYSSGRRESLPSALDELAPEPVLHDVNA